MNDEPTLDPTCRALTLVVERSSRCPGWALFRGDRCEVAETDEGEPARDPEWLARLGAALARHRTPLAAIDRFVVGIGPGSFSGTRAAVAAAQGMALPGGRPVLGVSSAAAVALAALAARTPPAGRTAALVVGDARRGRLWTAHYLWEADAAAGVAADGAHGRLLRVGPDGAAVAPTHDENDFVLATWEELPRLATGATCWVSPDWDRLGTRLAAHVPEAPLARAPCVPTARDVGRLFLADPAAARAEPVPIYLHPAVAEVCA